MADRCTEDNGLLWDLRYKLDFVNKHIAPSVRIRHSLSHHFVQFKGITVLCIIDFIQSEPYDLIFIYPAVQQILTIKSKQKIGLPAPENASDDLNTPVVLFWD